MEVPLSASTLLNSLFRHKAWANEELYAEVAKLDPATHQAERHSAIRLLNHIFVVDRIFRAHLAGEAHGYAGTNTPETPTLDELREAAAATDRWYVEYTAGVPAERLGEAIGFTFTDGLRGRMTREEMLAHVVTHGSYHRGGVGRILAQAGVQPPRDIYTVFLHRAEPQRRKAA